MRSFRPHPLLRGGHRQTLLGYWLRRRLVWEEPVEDLIVDAGDDVRLLLRASWQPRPESRPTLVLVHGLGGCDRATYGIATGRVAWRRGWNVVRLNLRGAGDSEAVCARLYHAGVDDDILAALAVLGRFTPRLALAGFSLGGNIVLLALGRQARRLPSALIGAAAVSAPVDLAASVQAIERPVNRVYHAHYVRELCAAYRRRQRRRPDLYAAGAERGLRTIREYDAAITAPHGGFRDVDDYYARSSAGPHLAAIERETLVLLAADDPLVPAASVERWPIAAAVRRERLPTGGHVGFVGPTEAAGRFWAGERVVDFLDGLSAS